MAHTCYNRALSRYNPWSAFTIQFLVPITCYLVFLTSLQTFWTMTNSKWPAKKNTTAHYYWMTLKRCIVYLQELHTFGQIQRYEQYKYSIYYIKSRKQLLYCFIVAWFYNLQLPKGIDCVLLSLYFQSLPFK